MLNQELFDNILEVVELLYGNYSTTSNGFIEVKTDSINNKLLNELNSLTNGFVGIRDDRFYFPKGSILRKGWSGVDTLDDALAEIEAIKSKI